MASKSGGIEGIRIGQSGEPATLDANFRILRDALDAIMVSGTLLPHATTHQNGGTDEISVLGLSGLLADAQTPLSHDHGALHTGLTDDDHTQYALLAGRSGGQTLNFGTGAGENGTISSTVHGTKGKLLFGTSAYNEVNNRLGIGTANPELPIHLYAAATADVFEGFGPDTASGPSFNIGYAGASFGRGSGFMNVRPDASATGIRPALYIMTNNLERLVIDKSGNLLVNALAAAGTSAAGVFAIKTGTAPTTGPADCVQFYSSDDAAGHTIPSFYCEGTNVVATGQADSASSVRVKMRINGTVRTFLCI